MRRARSFKIISSQFMPICIAYTTAATEPQESNVMLALIMSLLAGRSYRWQPDLDVSDSFVLSTLFADGGH
jgi:hypothetical protein